MGEMLAMWLNTYSRLFETGYTAFHFLFFFCQSVYRKNIMQNMSVRQLII